MTNLVTVWDKDGKPHRMTRPNARDLVNFAGWTNVPPVVLEAAKATDEALKAAEAAAEQEATAKALEEAQKVAEARAAEVAAAAAVAAQEAAKQAADAAEKVAEASTASEPSKMDVPQLLALAKNLGIEGADAEWGKRRLLREIKEASKGGTN